MAASVGGMYVNLESNVVQFRRDMGKAAKAVESNQAKMNKSLFKLQKGFKNMTGVTKKFAGGIASIQGAVVSLAAAGGFAYIVKSSLDAADNLAKMADMAGVSTDFLQEMQFAAEQNGVSLRDMGDAVKRLQRRVGLFATDGGGPAAKALEELNIQVKDAQGNVRSTEDIFNEAIRKLDGYNDSATKAAIASQLFGDDAGPRLLVLLNQGSQGIEEYRKQAQELGLVMDESLLRKAEEANDKMDILASVIKTRVTVSVVELAPQIAGLATSFTEALPSMINYVQKFGEWVGFLERAPMDKLQDIQDEIDKLESRTSLTKMLSLEDEEAKIQSLVQQRDKLIVQIERQRIAQEKLNAANGVKTTSKGSVKNDGKTIKDANNAVAVNEDVVAKEVEGLATIESKTLSVAENMKDAMQNASGSISSSIGDMVTSGKADFDSLFSSLQSSIVNNLTQSTLSPINDFVSSGIGSLLSGIGGGASTGASSGGGIASFASSIFGGFFAEGGKPPLGKVSVVGENGPELFVPDSAGTIVPNHALGGSSGSVTVNNSFNISATGSGGDVKQQIIEMLPEIERRSVDAVSRAISRGGYLAKQVGAKK